MRTAFLVAISIGPVASLRAADLVVLTDGDRLTGTVQKLEQGKLTLKTNHSETPLQIDWALVADVQTESQETRKMLDSTCSLVPAEESESAGGWLRRLWNSSTVSADFGQNFSGESSYNQLSANSEINYAGGRWDASLVTHYYYYGATDEGRSTYQAYGRIVAQRYIHGDHFFIFPYAFLGRQTTSEGGRGQMRQYGGGIGWTFRRQYEDQVSLYSGLVRSKANGFTLASDEVRADAHVDEPLFIAAISWDKTHARKITTSLRLYYFKPILESGRHALGTDASAKIPLFGPMNFTVRVFDTPELRQRQMFSMKNLQVSSGIGIEF